MKNFFLATLLMFSGTALADDLLCQSRLLRMDMESSALERILQGESSTIMKGLETYLQSEAFQNAFLTEYPMPAMGMPFNSEQCLKEKAQGDPKFRNVDCSNPTFCSDKMVPEAAKKEVCYSIPCSLIVSDVRKCPVTESMARPVLLHYPTPIKLKRLQMKPTEFTHHNGRIKACSVISALEISLAIDVEFDRDPRVQYEKIGLEDLVLNLEGTRKACMSARLDLSSSVPFSDIRIERQDGDFVNYNMISKMLNGAKVRGLQGVDETALEIVKSTVLPPMSLHFRSTVEAAIEKSLATAFESRLKSFVNGNSVAPDEVHLGTTKDSFTSEFGVSNIAIKKYLDLLDCSLLKAERKPIPEDAACYKALYEFSGDVLTFKEIPKVSKTLQILRKQFSRYHGVSSEALRLRMVGLKSRIHSSEFESFLHPMIQDIGTNQANSPFSRGVALMNKSQDQKQVSMGVSFPDICDPSTPSAHEGRSMPGCPIQTYIDLDELNKLFASMYDSGRLCHQGKGDFRPERDRRENQVYNRDGSPRGEGCLFILEDDEDGLRCYLNGSPTLAYDASARSYRMQLNTRQCFRGGVFGPLGKIGGDIDFGLSFRAGICEGDFCLEDIQAQWSVVPGTARYALKESSWFNGMVHKQVNKKIRETLQQTIRIPMSGGTGPMAMIPLEAEGRTDQGPGYFGACLKVRSK